MSSAAAVTYAFNVKRAGPSKVLSDGPALAPVPSGRVPRVARLLALADRFQRMLDHGEVASMAEIAKLGRVSRAHVTQIMDLLLLAPDIQEEILCLPATKSGRDVVTLREMRRLPAVGVAAAYYPDLSSLSFGMLASGNGGTLLSWVSRCN